MEKLSNREKIRALLLSIQTGDPDPAGFVNEAKYIQHNPQTHEGSEGLAALFKRLSQTNPRVAVVRAFQDGDFVFAHTEYDFSRRNIGFEVFRFEDGRAVEHWDNIQKRMGPNADGRSMVDGPVDASDLEKTEDNRDLVRCFIETVLIADRVDQIASFMNRTDFVEHNPHLTCAQGALEQALLAQDEDAKRRINYQFLHRVLAEGNYVLGQSEGQVSGNPAAFYDLFRVEDGKIVEHWDTTELIALKSQWKNQNGKF